MGRSAFNDIVPYESKSKWLMDDGVVVEPLVGTRVFDSLAILDETMKLVWGPGRCRRREDGRGRRTGSHTTPMGVAYELRDTSGPTS